MQNLSVPGLLMVGALLCGAFLGDAAPAQAQERPAVVNPRQWPETVEDTAQVRLLLARSRERLRTQPDEAMQYAQKALSLAQKLRFEQGVATGLKAVGSAHLVQGRLEQALGHYMEAYNAFSAVGDRQGVAGALMNIGIVFAEQGDLPQALDAYLQALKQLKELGDTEAVALCLNNLGIFHWRLGNLQKALAYYRQSARLHKTLGNRAGQARVLNNMGVVFQKQHAYEKALEHHLRALRLYEVLDDRAGTAAANNNIGAALNRMGQHTEALAHLKRAARTSRELGTPQLAATYDEMGRAYQALDQLDEALTYTERSYVLAREDGAARMLETASRTLSEIYAARGNYRQAFRYRKRYGAVKDSVFSQEKTRIIARMQARYETEKKGRKIDSLQQKSRIQALQAKQQRTTRNALLGGLALVLLMCGLLYNRYRLKRKANRLLRARQEEIQQSAREKEVLLKEIHHRVKNNLQVITSLLNLREETLHESSALDAVHDVQNRVQAMALVHQRLFETENPGRVDVERYLEELCAFLLRAFDAETRAVGCRVNAAGFSLNMDTAVILGLIVSELLSNALKHAFPDGRGGRIDVVLRAADGGGYELKVADNGVGFPTAPSRGSSTMGLTLVRDLTYQLDGRLHTRNGVGVTHVIRFGGTTTVSA